MKIVINTCWGGFGLSEQAAKEIGCNTHGYTETGELKRNDPKLVEVVERLGHTANGPLSALAIVEIPDDVDWGIHDYDGIEHVYEVHRTWP